MKKLLPTVPSNGSCIFVFKIFWQTLRHRFFRYTFPPNTSWVWACPRRRASSAAVSFRAPTNGACWRRCTRRRATWMCRATPASSPNFGPAAAQSSPPRRLYRAGRIQAVAVIILRLHRRPTVALVANRKSTERRWRTDRYRNKRVFVLLCLHCLYVPTHSNEWKVNLKWRCCKRCVVNSISSNIFFVDQFIFLVYCLFALWQFKFI